MKLFPLAEIKRDGRTDYVFLSREDMERDFPDDATVRVIGGGGVVIATKPPGEKNLSIEKGVDMKKHFEEAPTIQVKR